MTSVVICEGIVMSEDHIEGFQIHVVIFQGIGKVRGTHERVSVMCFCGI